MHNVEEYLKMAHDHTLVLESSFSDLQSIKLFFVDNHRNEALQIEIVYVNTFHF